MARQPDPQHVQPQPAPASWEIGEARAPDGSTFVILAFHTVGGTQVNFLDPNGAKGLAAALEQKASQVATGLILPNGPVPPAFRMPG